MKIGILTFHRVINYGACLQSYALLTYIKKKQHSVEIVDFIPNSELDKRSWKRKTLHLIKTILSARERKYQLKKKKFNSFISKHFDVSKEKIYGDKNANIIVPKYDLLISGSDQIFNLNLSGNSFTYYLPFDNVKKMSYASSFGREKISDLEKWAVLKYLPSFSNLSFREKSGFNIANNLISLQKENLVVDPVFLLQDYEWMQLIKKKRRKRNYILIYAMEKTDWIESTINVVSKAHPNYELILVKGSDCKLKTQKVCKIVETAGPEDFLSLISNSSLIITNSFHGLAFSIIFKKRVYCCAHSNKNIRLENLLTLVNQKEKLISQNTSSTLPLDGSIALTKLKSAILKSEDYILNSIKGIENDR